MEKAKPVTHGKNRNMQNEHPSKSTYIFQNIPIIKDTRKIEIWQKDMFKFIWQDKKP